MEVVQLVRSNYYPMLRGVSVGQTLRTAITQYNICVWAAWSGPDCGGNRNTDTLRDQLILIQTKAGTL